MRSPQILFAVSSNAALTVLPEALRGFADYRMLIYAIVLILIMIVTNNSKAKHFVSRILPKRERKEKSHG